MPLNAARDLMRALPTAICERLENEGWETPDVMAAAEDHIDDLSSTNFELSNKLAELEIKHERAMDCLILFGKKVMAMSNLEADLSFKCDQGSEAREFERGTYCGRTDLANDFLNILMEKKEV